MAELKVTASLPASTTEVWAIIGEFSSLAEWHPMVPNCRASEDGQSRIISLPGVEVVETLIPGASPPMGHTYTVGSTPMPITDYRATLKLEAEGSSCRIIYQSRFEPVGVSEARAARMLRGFSEAGFAALAARLSATP